MNIRIIFCVLLFLSISISSISQEKPIRIVDEKVNNRLILYAINENLIDYDVLVTVEGTGFRQRKGNPRLTRLPATSRVKVKNLLIERGKQAVYTYTVEANDSLSRRALRQDYTKIKINPDRPILLYSTERCILCDTLISSLNEGIYKYKTLNLSEKPNVEEVLKRSFPNIDTITAPIFNLGGILYTNIETYTQLLEKLKEEDQ